MLLTNVQTGIYLIDCYNIMKLLIVESPTKAKTLERYLGQDFKVISSYGHVRTLPSIKDAVKPNDDFKITYKILEKSKNDIKNLCDNIKKANTIFLATDPDREGEAIAWHILEIMKDKKSIKQDVTVKRIVFHEITQHAVLNAINNPRKLDTNLVYAQQARQALDYLVGFTLSPILWRKLPGSKSAGRVQSVALKLLCERENVRDKFQKEEYWTIDNVFQDHHNNFLNAQLIVYKGKKLQKFSIKDHSHAKKISEDIQTLSYKILSIEKKEIYTKPCSPFITSTLIQEASKKLRFSAKKTMSLAQKLYEGIEIKGEVTGLITYIRTDSVTTSNIAIQDIILYIKHHYGSRYLPLKPIIYKSKLKNAQEAHEAIRPTNVKNDPNSLKKYLDNDCINLYELIWQRTISSQMHDAISQSTSVKIKSQCDMNIFKVIHSAIIFDGFYIVYKESKDCKENEYNKQNNSITTMQQNESLRCNKVNLIQHFTKPLPRYNEATLVKAMETLSIGRPSTYPKIISILLERKYAKTIKQSLMPEAKGRLVSAFLNKFFNKYVDYDFTANLENDLDDIASGKRDWRSTLLSFWTLFKTTSDEVLKIKNTDIISEIETLLFEYIFQYTNGEYNKKCVKCEDGTLGLRTGKFGAFIGCSNYPKCDFKRTLFLKEAKTEVDNEYKLLGTDKKTQADILLKKGPYGLYLEKEENKKKKRISLPIKFSLQHIELEFAIDLLKLPKILGKHPDTGENIYMKISKYGLYLQFKNKFYALHDIKKIHLSLGEAVKMIDNFHIKVSTKNIKN